MLVVVMSVKYAYINDVCVGKAERIIFLWSKKIRDGDAEKKEEDKKEEVHTRTSTQNFSSETIYTRKLQINKEHTY